MSVRKNLLALSFLVAFCAAVCSVLILGFMRGCIYLVGISISLLAVVTVCGLDVVCFRQIRLKLLSQFSAKSRVRNVSRLVIGIPSVDDGGSLIIPDCISNQTSAFELLRHVFSIVQDDGEVVFSIRKKCLDRRNDYSVADLLFFHPVTVKRLGLEREARNLKWCLILHPIQTVKLLLEWKTKSRFDEVEVPKEIVDFCKERKLRISMRICR